MTPLPLYPPDPAPASVYELIDDYDHRTDILVAVQPGDDGVTLAQRAAEAYQAVFGAEPRSGSRLWKVKETR